MGFCGLNLTFVNSYANPGGGKIVGKVPWIFFSFRSNTHSFLGFVNDNIITHRLTSSSIVNIGTR